MVEPGDEAGDCPNCEQSMTTIGHGHSAFGAVCEDCNLLMTYMSEIETV